MDMEKCSGNDVSPPLRSLSFISNIPNGHLSFLLYNTHGARLEMLRAPCMHDESWWKARTTNIYERSYQSHPILFHFIYYSPSCMCLLIMNVEQNGVNIH